MFGIKLKYWFVTHAAPWFGRGYFIYMGSGAGVFAFDGVRVAVLVFAYLNYDFNYYQKIIS